MRLMLFSENCYIWKYVDHVKTQQHLVYFFCRRDRQLGLMAIDTRCTSSPERNGEPNVFAFVHSIIARMHWASSKRTENYIVYS